MAKRHTRHRRQKRYRHKTMRGGDFTEENLTRLRNYGLNPDQIETLNTLGIPFNIIEARANFLQEQGPYGYSGNSDNFAEELMIGLLNEEIFDNQNTQQLDAIPHAASDEHNLDMDQSFESQGTMNLDELNTSQGTMNSDELNTGSNMSGYTTEADESFGGRQRKRITKKRRGRKGRKTRKQKGGMCYGNGVGANSYDPNYSIYNTNMLKLFPYRSTN